MESVFEAVLPWNDIHDEHIGRGLEVNHPPWMLDVVIAVVYGCVVAIYGILGDIPAN